MTVDVAELVAFVGAALMPASFFAGRFLRLARRESPPAAEPDLCVGYVVVRRGDDPKMHADCEALRSPTCIDGRCSFHCKEMCKCS